MVKVFSSPFKVTQKFGVNPDYYKQFGLTAHEGLDLVPTGSDWSIFSLPYKGIVVKDIDMKEKGGAYGVTTTIWYKEINEAWQYCHMQTNAVYQGQELEPGQYLGQMGATGNTKGAHLHLNRFKVDSNGYRLDKNNGYLGGIDPLPFLEKDPAIITQPIAQQPQITDQTRIPQILDDQGRPREVQAIRSDLIATHQRVGELDGQIGTLQENLNVSNKKFDDLSKEYEGYRAQNPPLAGLSLLELIQLYLKKKQG